MMRSLYSGVSGLRVHQTKMDVIGNNIANVNTVGFKASSVNFSDIYYQTLQSATGPNETTGAGGQNAMQIGLGSSVASIVASITQTGGSQRTDNPYDVMISGDSFFIVNSGGTNYFTKAGDFLPDENGTLTTSSGAVVMGWQPDPADPTTILKDTVSPLRVMSPENLFSEPEATTEANISGNIDPQDKNIVSSGSGEFVSISFYDSIGQEYTAKFKVLQTTTSTSVYNVTLSDITDKNGKSIFVTYDETNKKYIANAAIGTVKFGGQTLPDIADSNVDPDTGEITWPASTGTNTMSFNASGKFIGIDDSATAPTASADDTKSLGLSIGVTGNNPFKDVNVDFSTITQYGASGTTSIEGDNGTTDGKKGGRKAGTMTGIGIDESGKIYGKYDNGDSKLLGQIAVASFSNPSGLEAVGNNMFAETLNSGSFDGIGHDVTSDGGGMTTGVLEMSNVDLSAQFTDMITTQRGFQANSRVITTSDTLLEELINLKR
ncbi:flagellar hook-basal body complex protein [Anaerocolumna sedimenticola]|uniref:Flagellar hook protein FlgE n=1 Tax=Anaerocolumna sedimenticola TaxID=2696063 RepID=A0A6P1TPF0_9FIRM|nr:flagellar hook protein FlgE [Anaerocolumna sedimenticola]QHQ62079.1 flagellar hook-basal body complex protein [Anaerocolumna sedimenticola]